MKKTGIMNAPISTVIAHLEHSDMLTIGDAGLPIPETTQRIDLALKPGVPGLLETLEAEFTPYSNVILVAGAWGFNL